MSDMSAEPPNDAKHLVALLRGMPSSGWKLLLRSLSDPELLRWFTGLEEINKLAFQQVWQQVQNAKPRCPSCGWRHWPGDPTCTRPERG